ncbi:MAG TPA: hypothetical protein PKD58_00020 [Candidatus Sumerlaeota bacterium]|nr:hypothetical protein [Candidatus Sumerlaeota bacterium]
MKKSIMKCLAAVALLGTAAMAPAAVVEGFEVNTPPVPFGWIDAGSPVPQTFNKAATAAWTRETTAASPAGNVTEGTQCGRLNVSWTLPGAAGTNPSYLPGTDATYWSLRINAPTGPSQSSIPHTATLTADIFNHSTDTYQFAFTLIDSEGLKNLPFLSIPPGATTVSWDLSLLTTAGAGVENFTGSTKALVGSSSFIRGLFVFTDSAATPTGPLILDVDNVQLLTSQTDFTPPAPPTVLSLEQGTNPGDLIVKWAANSEPDLASYNIYLATNADFSTPILNRLSFPALPVANVAAPATQTTLTGVDTTQPVYIRMTAIDNATPSANESLGSAAYGAFLEASGATPKDLVVLDYDRYAPSESLFTQNGYAHGTVYYSQALQTKGRTFVTINADAVENGSVTLAPGADHIVYWANALDGDLVIGQSLAATAQTALTTYVNAGGNLFISGNNLGKDLVTNAAGPTFFANILSASLVSDNAAQNALDNNNLTLFPNVAATFATGADVFNVAGYPTSDNEVLSPLSTAVGALAYSGNTTGSAGILNNGTTVYLGFGFESIRDVTTNPTSNFAAARAVRDALLGDAVDYLLAAPPSDASSWSMYQ